MGADHPAVGTVFRPSPLAQFYDEPVTIENGAAKITGTIDNIWRWFTDRATGIHVITPDGRGDYMVLGDTETWTVTHIVRDSSYTHDGRSNPFAPPANRSWSAEYRRSSLMARDLLAGASAQALALQVTQ